MPRNADTRRPWFGTSPARRGALAALVAIPAVVWAQSSSPPPAATKPVPKADWIVRSDENAALFATALARFQPEFAGHFGVEGFDDQVFDLQPKVYERSRAALVDVQKSLEKKLQTEKDPRVRQDLQIMIDKASEFIDQGDVEQKLVAPYIDLPQYTFLGLRALLDDQVDAKRRPAAVVRLRRYAGLEKGSTPIVQLAMDRTRERLGKKERLGPVKEEMEQSLGNMPRYLGGIEQLFQKYQLAGYEPALAKLKTDMAEYEAFVRKELIPRARTDFRQPAELYTMSLRSSGVDMPVDELVSRAAASFADIRAEMQALAPLVAKEKGFKSNDYRDVIRELKKEQLVGEAILPHYQERMRQIEEIIRREKIVTLPTREPRVRLASEAESASIPAPHMRPPRMINNTGEMGEFVLPLRIPSADGSKDLQFDDFTFAAASWTLSAHEARPGHEMQFAANVERGVSVARSLFAMNSTNAEGWGLYSEAEIKPYVPLDGQLIALQHRLLRAARAFLDPGLQTGTTTREEAMRILRQDVVLSEAMATQEVERYTFRSPGQAPSYFCGYSRLMALRTDTERALGTEFDRQRYHDFVLGQGLIPLSLLRKAVFEEFVPAEHTVAGRKKASGN